MSKRGRFVAATTLFAAVSGYVVGILTAPKSGKDTRKDIADNVSKGRIEAEKQLKKLHTEVDSLIKKGEITAKKSRTKAKKELDDAIAQAKKAKEKSREVLSAVRHGDADDPNLQMAVNELKNARKNLKDYLKKK